MHRVPRLSRAVLTAILAVAIPAASAQDDSALTSKLQVPIAAFHGQVSFFAHDLSTGRTVAIQADRPVPTASVIKLAILYEALRQIREGRASFRDPIALRPEDQVQGSGVLLLFDAPANVTFKDVLTVMISLSDNTAANLAMDHLGIANIDSRLVSLGLKNTWLYKKAFAPATGPLPDDQKQFGLGKSTAREMAGLMERFATCDLGPAPAQPAGSSIPSDKDLCATALRMLKVQFYRDGLPRHLEGRDAPSGITAIANKTGSLDHARNDVGAVFTSHGTIVISEFTHDNADISWTAENEAELLMAKLAQIVVEAWK